MPNAGVQKPSVASRVAMTLATPELVQPSHDIGFRDLFVCHAVVTYDAVAVGGYLDDAVQDVGVIALV